MRTYRGRKTQELIFPLGGIGTGSIGMAGNGRFCDWEIFNKPDKGSLNEYTHIAVKATDASGHTDARVLQGDETKALMGQYMTSYYRGYGYGPHPCTMAGFPHFRDHSFRKLDISGLMQVGENVIETRVLFAQSEKTYENMEKAKQFESEKNKLTYDMEIEAMYLVGDFGVRGEGVYNEIPRNASFFDGGFVLTAPTRTVTLRNLERQGYLFFSGELTVKKTFTLAEGDTARVLSFKKFGINAVRVKVNGRDMGTVMWAPYCVDLSDALVAGENTVELTLVNNLRNLLGPHHHLAGELFSVAPGHFPQIPCLWNGYRAEPSTPQYCFVNTGLEN